MRIWDIPPNELCRKHLLGEHRELHGLWNIHVHGKKGYSLHPETKRWRGKLAALYTRHQDLVTEMTRRGYNHHSPLDKSFAKGRKVQIEYIDDPEKQRAILRAKNCDCLRRA